MKLPFPRKLSTLILLGAFALTIALIATRERPEVLERPERAWSVDVVSAERQTLRPTLELFGSVQSPENAQLRAGIDGLVMEVAVLDGESVVADELLVKLDDRDARLLLQQAEADLLEIDAQRRLASLRIERSRQALEKEQELLALTEGRSDRARELSKDGLLSASDLDQSDENLKRQQLAVNQAQLTVDEIEIRLTELAANKLRAEALRDQAQLDLDRTEVRAPFDGVVSEMSASVGDRVRTGDELMRLQNPATIEVRTQIPARFAETVSEGLANGETLDALVINGERSIAGRLTRISGQVRETSGGVDSFVRFDSPPLGLRLGSTVQVYLELPPEPDVIALPAEALYGRNQLYRLVDSRMQMVEVDRIGERVRPAGGTEVLVRSDQLAETDQIIITKLSNAADGVLTRVAGEIASSELGNTEGAARDFGQRPDGKSM